MCSLTFILEYNAPFSGSIEDWWYILFYMCQIFPKSTCKSCFILFCQRLSFKLFLAWKNTRQQYSFRNLTNTNQNIPRNFYCSKIWCIYSNNKVSYHTLKHYFTFCTVLTQKIVLVLNQDSDDLKRSWFWS